MLEVFTGHLVRKWPIYIVDKLCCNNFEYDLIRWDLSRKEVYIELVALTTITSHFVLHIQEYGCQIGQKEDGKVHIFVDHEHMWGELRLDNAKKYLGLLWL